VQHYSAAIAVIEVVGALAFAYMAVLVIKLYSRLKTSELLVFTLSLSLLATSQVLAALSVLARDPRLAAVFYTSTSSLASAAFMLMTVKLEERSYIIAPTTMVLADFVAGTLALLASRRFRSEARLLTVIIGFSYYGRALSTIASSASVAEIVLLASEFTRALAATILSVYYALVVSKSA
jgi:hypothetical protein